MAYFHNVSLFCRQKIYFTDRHQAIELAKASSWQ
jgi:hypothetical protein